MKELSNPVDLLEGSMESDVEVEGCDETKYVSVFQEWIGTIIKQNLLNHHACEKKTEYENIE